MRGDLDLLKTDEVWIGIKQHFSGVSEADT
jgi:hypothetical protein